MQTVFTQERCIGRNTSAGRRHCRGTIVCSRKGFGQKQEQKPKEARPRAPRRDTEAATGIPEIAQEVTGLSEFAAPRAEPPPQQQQGRGSVQEVPEVVNRRLLNRMLTFSLLPVFLGFLSLPLLAYVQVGLKVDLPNGTAFVISGLFFGAGILGITYGILSASWDESRDGSALGLEEFKSNAGPLFDRLKNGSKR